MSNLLNKHAIQKAKPLRKLSVLLSVFMLGMPYAFILNSEVKRNELVDKYYSTQLISFREALTRFKSACDGKSPVALLKKGFLEARLCYKKLAVLSDYFDSYELKNLNGPAIDRIEEDNPDVIIPPHGFQAIETYLFADWEQTFHSKIAIEIDLMLHSVERIEQQPDRVYKFKDELLWDAMRSSILSITTLGITGFDSPLANYSLPEARAGLEGISSVLAFFKKDITEKDEAAFSSILKLIGKADNYLNAHPHFNDFDRLDFITIFINPLYKKLTQARIISGIAIPPGNRPFNYNALSIFSPDALNLDFYSPDKDYLPTRERVELGKKLFYDPILSGTKTRSCASCHQPGKSFTDGLATPLAIDSKTALPRNTPTLWNSVFQTSQFYDSRTSSLETQLAEVVHNAEEMQGSLNQNVKDLKKSPIYSKLFGEAYNKEKEPLVSFTIANAIASYVRSLVALNSRFDQYMMGSAASLSPAEKSGFNLFTGKARCATCHYIPLFNGLVPPEFNETESEVLGVPQTRNKKNAVLDPDLGKYGFTRSEIHKHAFRTPTLRNIALTAPYMHNGVYRTLEEVMDFYNNGGGAGLRIKPPNQTLAPDKLQLRKKEVSDIIAFLGALTDTTARQ